MKIFIRHENHEYIIGMATVRSEALKKLSKNSDMLSDHIIKCVLYKNMMPENLRHWIYEEICTWLLQMDAVKCKSKLKFADYKKSAFGSFGEDTQDALSNLYGFVGQYCFNRGSDNYPIVDIKPELATRLYDVYRKIESVCIPMFLDSTIYSRQDWYDAVDPILK